MLWARPCLSQVYTASGCSSQTGDHFRGTGLKFAPLLAQRELCACVKQVPFENILTGPGPGSLPAVTRPVLHLWS